MSLPIIANISLSNLIFNVKSIKRLIGKSKFCAVVKSDAYGHGLVEISSAIYPYVDAYAVSIDSECVALRHAGIDKEIILLTPVYAKNVERLIDIGITLTVSSENELKLIYRYALKIGKAVKIHIALNTGMNRLGFDTVSEVCNAVNYIKKHKNKLFLTGAFSHLGNVENERYTKSQKNKFNELLKPIKDYNAKAVAHLSASGGALLGDSYLYDMVRVGLMLYGYTPIKTDKIKLKKIAKLKALVVLNRNGVKNERLMYGDYKSNYDKVSVIRLGYADGIRRVATDGVIGNACMDLCAVKKVKGKYYYLNVEKLSNSYKTITYETLVNLLRRAERIYK